MRKIFTLALASMAMLSMSAQQKGPGLPKLPVPTKNYMEGVNGANQKHSISQLEGVRPVEKKRDAVRRSQSADILYSAPGQEQYYTVTSEGYYIYWSEIFTGEISGLTIINTDGNDVFIKNPLPRFKANTYVRGTKDGDKITVQLPQAVDAKRWTQVYEDYPEYSYDETDVYELNLMHLYTFEMDGQTYASYITVTEDNFVTYTISEDGSIALDLDGALRDEEGNLTEYPEYILGVTYYTIDHLNGDQATEPAWGYYGDWAQTYTVSNILDEVITLPAGIELDSDWMFTADEGSKSVSVGFDEDKIYVVGFSKMVPHGVIYGNYDSLTGQYVFPNAQNIGYSQEADEFIYLIGINENSELIDLVFDYDASTKRLVSAQDQAMLENSETDRIYYWESYTNPKFLYQTEEDVNAIPANPIYNYYNTDYDAFDFTMPLTNINGYVMETDRIFYNVYANGELYTFRADQGGFFNRYTYEYYPEDEEFTNIDYAVYDFDYLYWFNNTLEIHIPEEGIESVGVQVFYNGSDGILYKSDLVTGYTDGSYQITDGNSSSVESLASDKILSIEYYDFSGMRVANPTHGLYIKRSIMSDGTIKTQKITIR